MRNKRTLAITLTVVALTAYVFAGCAVKVENVFEFPENPKVENAFELPENQFDFSWDYQSLVYQDARDILDAMAQTPDLYGYTQEELASVEICNPFQYLTVKDGKLIANNSLSYILKSSDTIKGTVNLVYANGEYITDYSNYLCAELNGLMNTKGANPFVLISDGLNTYALTSDDMLTKLTDRPNDGHMIPQSEVSEMIEMRYENVKVYAVDLASHPIPDADSVITEK